MSSLILHCGGRPATFEEVAAIEPPEQTPSYRPVPHGDLVRLLQEEVEQQFRLEKPRTCFGLAKDGRRLFGTLTYDLDHGENARMVQAIRGLDLSAFGGFDTSKVLREYHYSIAFRNSYDKSMSVAVAGGTNSGACDNLCIWGSDFSIKLQHSPGVWDRLIAEVVLRVRGSMAQFQQSVVQLETMKRQQLTRQAAFETIGHAMGVGVLTSVQASKALAEYRRCEKEEEHNFHALAHTPFALYQHFTEALKLGKDVSRKMDKYTGVSRLFEERGLAPKLAA